MGKSDEREQTIYDICFDYPVKDIDEALESGRALELQVLLNKYKEYLKEKDHESYEAYTVQRLRSRIESHYGSRDSFTDEQHKRQSIYNTEISIA